MWTSYTSYEPGDRIRVWHEYGVLRRLWHRVCSGEWVEGEWIIYECQE